uniref:Mitochondrial ribosomal protein L38 n=1 Tax=Molossus molossus TaxID=27622 RepID=A0A7J8D0J5_MOLMO|nr:mitochondrial ribosomal protein L38 [Molossus molossus]
MAAPWWRAVLGGSRRWRGFSTSAALSRRTPPLGPMPNEDIDVSNLERLEKYRTGSPFDTWTGTETVMNPPMASTEWLDCHPPQSLLGLSGPRQAPQAGTHSSRGHAVVPGRLRQPPWPSRE